MNTPPPIITKRRIKRFAPLQLGKMLGILYGLLGLLAVPFLLLISAFSTHLPPEQRVGMMAMGVGFALMIPVMYAAMGFVCGIVCALLYNLIAKWIGGIEVEVE